MRLIATIEDPAVVKKILNHLGISTDVPEAQPARPPPNLKIACCLAPARLLPHESPPTLTQRIAVAALVCPAIAFCQC